MFKRVKKRQDLSGSRGYLVGQGIRGFLDKWLLRLYRRILRWQNRTPHAMQVAVILGILVLLLLYFTFDLWWIKPTIHPLPLSEPMPHK